MRLFFKGNSTSMWAKRISTVRLLIYLPIKHKGVLLVSSQVYRIGLLDHPNKVYLIRIVILSGVLVKKERTSQLTITVLERFCLLICSGKEKVLSRVSAGNFENVIEALRIRVRVRVSVRVWVRECVRVWVRVWVRVCVWVWVRVWVMVGLWYGSRYGIGLGYALWLGLGYALGLGLGYGLGYYVLGYGLR